ncbi:ankyrin repeat domain-containing protein [Candidatus Tisiphia endosymbiont of Thecophora atra]|uniref:ankyrin repeat domain-containing protein n=1 Tax=Candidatus Tisiphia endosymbiont of Thecophora atra TaxID=3066258 RepID=UPI00312CA093
MPDTQRLSESENESFVSLIRNKNFNALEKFINSKGSIDTNQSVRDAAGQSFLQVAVIYGSYEILELLLQKCYYDLKYQDANGNTVYHYAADLNKNNELALLIRRDQKSALIPNKENITPCDITKARGNDIGCKLLSDPVAPLTIIGKLAVINLYGNVNSLDIPKTIIDDINAVPQDNNILEYSLNITGDVTFPIPEV